MDNASRFAVPSSLAISDSGFLFLASTGETFTLNLIAQEVFTMLKEGVTVDAIRAKVLSDYDVDKTTLERDIDDFLTQLQHFKLILSE